MVGRRETPYSCSVLQTLREWQSKNSQRIVIEWGHSRENPPMAMESSRVLNSSNANRTNDLR